MIFIKSIFIAICLYSTISVDSFTNLVEEDSKSVKSLRVIGIPWIPFAYLEEKSRDPRGIDVSLVAAVAKKLECSIEIQLNGTLFEGGSPRALLRFFVNR